MTRLWLLCLLTSCGGITIIEEVEESEDESGSVEEFGVPVDVRIAFEDACAVAGCHVGPTPAQGLSLEPAYVDEILTEQAVQIDMPLVEVGNAPNSYIYVKLRSGPPVGLQMPPGQTDLIEVNVIRVWIEDEFR